MFSSQKHCAWFNLCVVIAFSQLFYDGHHNIAVELGTLVRADPPCPPSDKLLHAVVQGLAIQDQSKENMNIFSAGNLSMIF